MESSEVWEKMKPLFDATFERLETLEKFGIGSERIRALSNKVKLASLHDCLCRYKTLTVKQMALAQVISEITERDERNIARDASVDWKPFRNTGKPYRSMYT